MRAKDRRVARTERVLRDALVTLLHEKPYDDIVVKEILDRADVGRSTFYAHFRDKDELLASCMRDLLDACYADPPPARADGRERALTFSLPFLEYHERRRRAPGARMSPADQAALHERMHARLASRVAAELRTRAPSVAVPTELLARHVASTFGLVLRWWLERDRALPPRAVDERFRALVSPTLDALVRAR